MANNNNRFMGQWVWLTSALQSGAPAGKRGEWPELQELFPRWLFHSCISLLGGEGSRAELSQDPGWNVYTWPSLCGSFQEVLLLPGWLRVPRNHGLL